MSRTTSSAAAGARPLVSAKPPAASSVQAWPRDGPSSGVATSWWPGVRRTAGNDTSATADRTPSTALTFLTRSALTRTRSETGLLTVSWSSPVPRLSLTFWSAATTMSAAASRSGGAGATNAGFEQCSGGRHQGSRGHHRDEHAHEADPAVTEVGDRNRDHGSALQVGHVIGDRLGGRGGQVVDDLAVGQEQDAVGA